MVIILLMHFISSLRTQLQYVTCKWKYIAFCACHWWCAKTAPKDIINKALLRNQSQTGGLAQILQVKLNARVMLTANVDIEDRLINGQIGTVKHIT